MIILKIALRNLFEHKTKTIIIGALIALGIVLLVAGNSVIDTIKIGMSTSYRENFTSDLILHGRSKETFSLMPMPTETEIPVLHKTAEAQSFLRGLPGISGVLPLLGGNAALSYHDSEAGFCLLWGVDFETYRAMFPDNLDLMEGSWPKPGEAALLLPESLRISIEEETGIAVHAGETLILSSTSGAGAKIREMPISGIFKFRNGNEQLNMISLIDAPSLRKLKGMTGAAEEMAASPAIETFGDESALFADFDAGSGQAGNQGTAETVDYEAILGDVSVRDKYSQTEGDAWNYILVRLEDSKDMEAGTRGIATWLAANQSNWTVSDWLWAAGMSATLVTAVQAIFNIVVVAISVVVMIIIMNTLVISVTERIPEIGTIRAIGGTRGFIRGMIVSETLMISAVFGTLGIAVGSVIVMALNMAGLQTSNEFLQALIGGSVLHPTLSAASLGISLIFIIAVGSIASLYPVTVALRVDPVRAMQKI